MVWLNVVSAALAGLALGWLIWLASRRFIEHYQGAASEQPASSDESPAAPAWAKPPRGAIIVVVMTLWGGWVGAQAASLAVAASALIVTALLLCVALVDLQTRRIPDALALALLTWAVVQILWLGQPGWGAAALGLVVTVGLVLLVRLFLPGALGLGDAKLEAATGALLGYPVALAAVFAGVLAGGLAAALLLFTGRAGRKDPLAYGPYLALGAWLVYVRMLGLWPG